MKRWRIVLLIPALLVLAACLPSGNARPDDPKLRDGIKLLVTNFSASHPQLVNWDAAAVKSQIAQPLPRGLATEAGWTIVWPQATTGQLSRVVIPWTILGQYPSKFAPDSNNYSGIKLVPDSIAVQIRKLQQGGDEYFAAIVNQRFSTKDSSWLIFTSIPYLPVTDNAYGWAHLVAGKWQIVDFGTATVGCGKVPAEVQAEFGMSCPT